MKNILLVFLIFQLFGCGVARDRFYADTTAPSTTSLCRAYPTADTHFAKDLDLELALRGVSASECDQIITNQNQNFVGGVALGLGLLAVGVAASIAVDELDERRGRNSYDDYDWDYCYNSTGELEWMCRDIGTGQTTCSRRCRGIDKTDNRWPGLD